MSRKRKHSPEEIIYVCKSYLDGEKSASQLCIEIGLASSENPKPPGAFWNWISKYRCDGDAAFIQASENKAYSKDFKTMVVEEYLSGCDSLADLAAKYHIPSGSTLHQWILLYNANRELKDYNLKREVYMAEAKRKTTIDERKEIVKYCIEHNRNYKETAALFDVSYSQVYSWVKKYDITGADGLSDRRGRHKKDDEVDELERLRRENLRLKHQLEEKDMVVELLKKVKEFERM